MPYRKILNMNTITLTPEAYNVALLSARIFHMMSFIKTPQQLDSLENAISQYFAQKVDAGLDALCDSKKITLDTIEEWGKEHLRTSHK